MVLNTEQIEEIVKDCYSENIKVHIHAYAECEFVIIMNDKKSKLLLINKYDYRNLLEEDILFEVDWMKITDNKLYNPNYTYYLEHFNKSDYPELYNEDGEFNDDEYENGGYLNILIEMAKTEIPICDYEIEELKERIANI